MSIQTAYQELVRVIASINLEGRITADDVALVREAYIRFENELRASVTAVPLGTPLTNTIVPSLEPTTVAAPGGKHWARVYLTEHGHAIMADVFVRGPGPEKWRRVDHVTAEYSQRGAEQVEAMLRVFGFRERVIIG